MFTKEFRISNGDLVKEKVSGFTGIVTGSAFYLTGCSTHLVTAKSKDNAEPIAIWYDEGRLEVLEETSINEDDVKSDANGCDIAPPIR